MRIEEGTGQDLAILKPHFLKMLSDETTLNGVDLGTDLKKASSIFDNLIESPGIDSVRFCGMFDENGMIGLCVSRPKAFRDDSDRIFVELLCLKEKYRDDGIVEKLLRIIEEAAISDRHKNVYVKISASDKETLKVLRSLGYCEERILLQRRILENESFEDVPKNIKAVTPEFLNEHINEFARLYFQNDKAHILTDSSTLETAMDQMRILETYLRKGKALVFCASNQSRPCGVIWAYLANGTTGAYMHVKQITVDDGWRHRNLGQSLYATLFRSMQRNNQHIVTTFVDSANVVAVSFYNKIGYKPIEFQMVKSLA